MKKKIFQKIKEKLKKADNIAILSHFDPDGDSIGSMIALSLALKILRKKSSIITAVFPKEYKWLLKNINIIDNPQKSYKPDLVFILDSSDSNRVNMEKIFKNNPFIINMDHHLDNKNFGDINCIENTSSVGELVFDLLNFLKVRITKSIAEAIYVAIITDTGNFRYENTKESTFMVAAQLVKAGLKPYDIVKKVYENRDLGELDVYKEALKNIKFVNNGKIVYTNLTTASKIEVRSVIDFIRTFEKAEVAIVFKKLSSKLFKISLRSKSFADVNKVAKEFGGGGHKKASGCTVRGREKEIIKYVIDATKKQILLKTNNAKRQS